MWEVNPLAGSIDSVIGFIQSREPARERERILFPLPYPNPRQVSSSFLQLVRYFRFLAPLSPSRLLRFPAISKPSLSAIRLSPVDPFELDFFFSFCRQWLRIRSRTLLPVSLPDLLRALSFSSFSFGLTSVSVVDGVLSRSAARASAFVCCCVW